LTNKAEFDFSGVAIADDVVDAALAIQQQQTKTKTFRGLSRIRPLITVLQDYSSVVDTFVQVKPDLLGLIWVDATPVSNDAKVLQLTYIRDPSSSFCRQPVR